MFSTLTGQGSQETFEVLRYGAVDFLQKPSSLLKADLKSQHELIVSRVKNAARAGIDITRYLRPAEVVKPQAAADGGACRRVYAIGSSYGCYGALLGLIPELRPDLPAAYLSVLHAAPPHVDAFAQYLNKHSSLTVCRAVDQQPLQAGTCYLASAFETVAVTNGSDSLSLQVGAKATVDPEKACDHLMVMLSNALKDRAAAILLSGIGEDGVAGVAKIIEGGGKAIIQDPTTCLCSDTTSLAVQRYGLPTVPPRRVMAEAVRNQCLNA
jgi:two-component system chemotaxis response regulator CheB